MEDIIRVNNFFNSVCNYDKNVNLIFEFLMYIKKNLDWVCGGQWNRMVSFLTNFVNSLRQSNVHVVVFFNGAYEESRFNEWIQKQEETRNRANAVSH